jgi:hypothetical protein
MPVRRRNAYLKKLGELIKRENEPAPGENA